MLGIVVSTADEASVAIGDQLRAVADWTAHADGHYRTDGAELVVVDQLHIELETPATLFSTPPALVAFASRHSGETGQLLTAHHTGNIGPAEYGGDPNTLARAAPAAHASALAALDEHAPAEYDVGAECTHHGPSTVGAPSLFVEVGSGPDQWTADAPARAVARAILSLRGVAADRQAAAQRRTVVGFGGGHYVPRLERVIRETDWAVGHVAADWALAAVADEALPRVVEAAFTQSQAAHAVVEGERPAVRRAIDRLGYRVVGETFLRETTDVSPELVAIAESRIGSVAAGLRFGAKAATADDLGTVCRLPSDLLETTRGIDRERTIDVVAAHAIAFDTDQGGSRPTGLIALPDVATSRSETTAEQPLDGAASADANPVVYDQLITGLLAVLQERYDSVDRDPRTATATTTAFDPAKARTLGVPEGPAFGRLADGEAVEVNGDRIPPGAVHERRERQFSLVVEPAETG
ncbi:MAG: uncharacterized protein conserved in archaea [halophilic archaeon J07HX5]|jgi:Uncharacterized protein conserved in archaea|nr:MAG: uncharacterized protein conserved in archaea [halophilic archaeon J07HX5]